MRLLRSSLEGCGDHHSNALRWCQPIRRSALPGWGPKKGMWSNKDPEKKVQRRNVGSVIRVLANDDECAT